MTSPQSPDDEVQHLSDEQEAERLFGDQEVDSLLEDERVRSVLAAPELQKLLGERARLQRLGRIRQLVFGSMDGLLVPLGVVSGVAAGTGDTKAVIVAGIAEAFAGALSMGAGEFISARSEAQVQILEVAKELEEMRVSPEFELAEMTQLLMAEGVNSEDAYLVATTLAHYPEAYAKTMVEKELGILRVPDGVRIPEAAMIAASYLVAAVIPLASYFFLSIHAAFLVSLGVTLLALITIGVYKGKLAKLDLVQSVAEVVAVGAVSGIGGYLLGAVLPQVFGY
jgi:VIT1/CCC1 family predicted Fe2+/Mn2+ transporter